MFARHASATLLRRTSASSLLISNSARVTRTLDPILRNWGVAANRLSPSPNLRYLQSSRATSGTTNGSAYHPAMEDDSTRAKFSAGADEPALRTALRGLLRSAGKGGRWSLTNNGQGLERGFKFKNFAKTWVSRRPESLFLPCPCPLYIRWTTHSPEGLSAKDVELAILCDSLARDFGEVAAVDSETCALRQASDRVVVDAGDCCAPPGKKKH
ncbi:transcriptional coactivator/pterin dehydratase [Xylariaceae sp. FL0594]|nr:transcriptional coactivator/pterin dehydratase [Xylariaceae sp. FL0594]